MSHTHTRKTHSLPKTKNTSYLSHLPISKIEPQGPIVKLVRTITESNSFCSINETK